MKILILGTRRDTQDTSAGSIARVLATRNEVSVFEYERGLVPFPRPFARLNAVLPLALKAFHKPPAHLSDRRLLAWIRGRRFDLVMVLSINLVPPDVVESLRATGALVVGWFPDHVVNLEGAEFVAAPYERLFFKDKVVVERFRAALDSKRFDFLPQSFDPALHRPAPAAMSPEGADVDVATFGNSYPYRATLFAPLLAERSIRTVIYGKLSWNADPDLASIYRRPVYGLRKSAAMRAAAIALNTNHYAELGGVNKRTFELAGMGAFQLTDGPAIGEYLEPGQECATFQGPTDLVEKVRYYLARPRERSAIAARGLERAFRCHTYQHRLNDMFARIPALRGVEPFAVPDCPRTPESDLPAGIASGYRVPELPMVW